MASLPRNSLSCHLVSLGTYLSLTQVEAQISYFHPSNCALLWDFPESFPLHWSQDSPQMLEMLLKAINNAFWGHVAQSQPGLIGSNVYDLMRSMPIFLKRILMKVRDGNSTFGLSGRFTSWHSWMPQMPGQYKRAIKMIYCFSTFKCPAIRWCVWNSISQQLFGSISDWVVSFLSMSVQCHSIHH